MYEESQKKSIIATMLYWLFIGLFLFILCAYIFRSCESSEIEDDVIFDEITKKAYEQSPDEFKVINYGLEKRFEAVEANQLLQLKYLYYLPSAKQMQLTIKFNKSYARPATDSFIPFDLILKDQDGNTLTNYFYEHESNKRYGYIRVAWNDVEFTDKSEYTLHIMQEKDGKKVLRGSFLLQNGSTEHAEIRLTKDIAPYIFENK